MHACFFLSFFIQRNRKLVEDSKGIALISPAAPARACMAALRLRARERTRSVQSLWNFPLAPPRTYALGLHAPLDLLS